MTQHSVSDDGVPFAWKILVAELPAMAGSLFMYESKSPWWAPGKVVAVDPAVSSLGAVSSRIEVTAPISASLRF